MSAKKSMKRARKIKEPKNQGAQERESANAKARNLRPKKERERFRPGAQKRKREDKKKHVPSSASTSHQHIIRLPSQQSGGERVPFVDNLKTAVEPLTEEEEKSLLSLLVEELNSLFPVNLDMALSVTGSRETMSLKIGPWTVRTWS
jgi:hypothetical protein